MRRSHHPGFLGSEALLRLAFVVLGEKIDKGTRGVLYLVKKTTKERVAQPKEYPFIPDTSMFGVAQTALKIPEPVRTPNFKQREAVRVLLWVTQRENTGSDSFLFTSGRLHLPTTAGLGPPLTEIA